ncbi:MAG: DNRLRE domain-containing protein [Bacteroidetes bacterium]|nr:DNRLRE domain-containing protein [Bacteroidota bacterium]
MTDKRDNRIMDKMHLIRISTLALLLYTCPLLGQSSSIVYMLSGKLEYAPFANYGESNEDNIIPDYSFCGYKQGGVKIPTVQTVVEVEALDGLDMRERLQNLIDSVGQLPMNNEGIRGAILLKRGLFRVDGKLYIRDSGVILRGSGQSPALDGGTELLASARYQHSLINIVGDEKQSENALFENTYGTLVDEEKYPESTSSWLDFDVSDIVASNRGVSSVNFILLSNSGTYVQYSSKEGTNPPGIKIFYRENGIDTSALIFPNDDTFIQGGSHSNENFGQDPLLRLKTQPDNLEYHREIFMKFDLTNIPSEIDSAKLMLFAKTDGTMDVIHSLYFSPYDDWTENELTYSNKFQSVEAGEFLIPITSDYVGVGRYSFEVANPLFFAIGDDIIVERTPNQHWVDTLGMVFNEPGITDWTPENYIIQYARKIVAINGNEITIDLPIVDAISADFGGGRVFKNYSSGYIENSGVENLFISSVYNSASDEEHGWTAVTLDFTRNCWIKNITANGFGYSCVSVNNNSCYNTIEECAFINPISIIDGSRRYSFYIGSGYGNLFQRCYADHGRHDYVTGSRVAGPNVFLHCFAENTQNDIGPHHRWATGTLFDNIQGGEMRVWNRGTMGTGHGWSGNQTIFWNCRSVTGSFTIDSPIGGRNMGIGCKGSLQTGNGYWESFGVHVAPSSLYLQQLNDRLGTGAVDNVTIQGYTETEAIWSLLKNWKGIGALLPNTSTVNSGEEIPREFSVTQNYPNPFNPSTKIELLLPSSGIVNMKILNILGEEVRNIYRNVHLSAGHHIVNVEAENFSSGVYFCITEMDDKVSAIKMVLTK